MMKKVFFLLFAFSGNILLFSFGQELTVIPLPNEMTIDNREPGFSINANTTLIADKLFSDEAIILSDYLKELTKLPALRITSQKTSSSGFIELKVVSPDRIPAEGYQLSVQQKLIQIVASDPAGAFYGCMTLLQILKKNETTNQFFIPAATINDRPRFGWRGLMLDCSRTFIPVSYLKMTIDRMSFYKLNTLHLHLTDDQGWRLEIKKYPLLTRKGAFFDKKYNEPAAFQGYYTQEQMRDLVKYAGKRHVAIIPEIEFPGHNHAALYAYPEFSCSGKSTPVYPFFSGIHITSSVFCPAYPKTFTFMKDVIEEVAAIFPSSYIHLGGDEVPKGVWEHCDACKKMMDTLRVQNQHQLQGYMMNRTGNDVLSQRRRPIGWDEIFSGGVNKNWVIMNWRNAQTARDAVRAGYDVILATRSNLYFDYDYNTTSTEKVYAFDPLPEDATDEEKKHYLGIQACFWSHIDRTQSRMDFQLYPRTLALAERAWSAGNARDYTHFQNRMNSHHVWFDYFNIIKRY